MYIRIAIEEHYFKKKRITVFQTEKIFESLLLIVGLMSFAFESITSLKNRDNLHIQEAFEFCDKEHCCHLDPLQGQRFASPTLDRNEVGNQNISI